MFQDTQALKQMAMQENPKTTQIRIRNEHSHFQLDKVQSKNVNQNQTHINYRPDIDGLRTVAISLVVIFHAWPYFMTGGFIGVDIFFTISGYLISRIIIKQTLQNKFSYTDFYSRRIKRIYPALIVVLVFVFIVAVNKLMEKHFKIISKIMAASTVFAANIQILTAERDYFDPDIQTNPLLHLWSLGVEEQFYIFWPLLLTVIFNKFSKQAFGFILAYTILSFMLSIYCVFNDTQFAFYFPFCRFWQMSVGGLIGYLNIKVHNKFFSNLLSIVSFIAIMTTVWIINQYTVFPGFWALIPSVGAALIIQSGSQSLINKYILSSKAFVFIGKISYSLYLWHWPLLVFSRLLYPAGSTSILSRPQVMIMISVALSILSYYLIQNPLRFRKKNIVTIVLFLIMIGIGFTAFYVGSHKNQLSQMNQNQKYNLETQNTQHVSTQQQDIIEQKIIENVQKLPINQQISQNKSKPSQNPHKKPNQKSNQKPHQNPQSELHEKPHEKTLEESHKNPYQQHQQQPKQKSKEKPNEKPKQKSKQIFNPWVPLQEDYIEKNGRKIPNSSKNPGRQPATVQKINFSQAQFRLTLKQVTDRVHLQKKINKDSIYYHEKAVSVINHFEVLNQGQENVVFIVGDSHARFILDRLKKLYEDAIKQGRQKDFPTIVSIVKIGEFLPNSGNDLYQIPLQLIKKHQPDRVYFVYVWLRCIKITRQMRRLPKEQFDFFSAGMLQFQSSVKQIKKIADSQIYMGGIQPCGFIYDPLQMKDQNGVIENNLKPFKYSTFHERYSEYFQLYDKIVKNLDAKVTDFVENMCYNDICEVLTPNGYPIIMDWNHLVRQYARSWTGCVDIVTQF